jgi:hypothetical protein
MGAEVEVHEAPGEEEASSQTYEINWAKVALPE